MVTNGFSLLGVSGHGQQGKLGGGGGTGANFYDVFQYVYYEPQPGSVLRIRVQLATIRSTAFPYDAFSIDIYNSSGYFVATLLFDENSSGVYQASRAASNYQYTGIQYQNSHVYTVEITLNYQNNTWSAKLDNMVLVSSVPLFAANDVIARDLGILSVAWLPVMAGTPGNNYVLFDDITVEQVQTVALATPAVLTAKPFSASLIYLTWDDDLFASRYELERSPNGVSGWTPVATINEDREYYLDTGLTKATKYYYRLRSVNDTWGASNYGPVMSATTFTEYEEWKDYYRLRIDAPANADPNQDGVPLLLEYALGASPKQPSNGYLPSCRQREDRLELVYYRARSDVTYIVETSTDLVNWSTAGVTQEQDISGLFVTAAVAYPGNGPQFLRLRVSIP